MKNPIKFIYEIIMSIIDVGMIDDIKQIKKIRKQLGLTQTELARLSGVSQSMIAKIERGRIEPSYSVAKRIIIALEESLKNSIHHLTAKDLCSYPIISVHPDDLLDKALELMYTHAISQIPVIEDERIIGSITESTLIKNYHQLEKDVKVKEVMEEPFPVISSSTPLSLVREMLKVYSAVIVRGDNHNIGIITKADLLKKDLFPKM